MINKLIMRLPIILIGLSLFFLTGCILFNIDPPNKYYLEKYYNSSNKEVTIVMIKSTTSTIIKSFSISQGKEEDGLYSGREFSGGDDPIKGYVDDFERGDVSKIELYVADVLVKEWIVPTGNFGSDINSPFNYDSWSFESMKPTGKNIVGKIVFTITDEDIE